MSAPDANGPLATVTTLVLAHMAQFLCVEDVVCLAHVCRHLRRIVRPTGFQVSGSAFWSLLPRDGDGRSSTTQADVVVFRAAEAVLLQRGPQRNESVVTQMIHVSAYRGCIVSLERTLSRLERCDRPIARNTAVAWASYGGHVPMVQELICLGVDVTVRHDFCIDGTERTVTIMDLASAHGHLPMIQFLVFTGALGKRGDDSSIMAAIRGGHAHVVEWFEQYTWSNERMRNRRLQCAVATQRADVVRAVVGVGIHQRSFSVKVVRECTQTACARNWPEMVAVLLKAMRACAPPRRKTSARSQYDHDQREFLIPVLRNACAAGHVDVVRVLLNELQGCSVLAVHAHHVLKQACFGGFVPIVRQLVQHPVMGGHVWPELLELDTAVQRGKPAVVCALLESRAFRDAASIQHALTITHAQELHGAEAALHRHAAQLGLEPNEFMP